jgi:plastocyanin
MKPLCTLILALTALVAAAPASADVYPDGTGEPAYTNTLTNTQYIHYEAPSGSDSYRLKAVYYRDNVQVSEVTWVPGPLSGTVWMNWQGVATLQEGSQYAICVTGYFSLPNDSLYFPDGPNSCSTGTNLGRRSSTTIDRTAPSISVVADGGAQATKSAEIGVDIGYQDTGAGPYPATYVCVQAGTTPCDQVSYSEACSVPKAPGKSTTFSCRADASALPDGPVTVCAIGTDGAVPDQPSKSDQTGSASSANKSTKECDTIVLDRAAPTAGIGASKTEALVGEEIAFTSQSSDPTTGVDAASATWQWGDGTADTAGATAGHKFTAPGTYVVKFRVQDGAGNQGVAQKTISVKAPPAPDPKPDPKPDPTPDPKPDPTPDPKPDPTPDPTPPGNDPDGGGGSDKPATPPDTTAIEKEIVAAAGGGTVFRTQIGNVSVLAPKRFRLGKSARLVVGVTTEQGGQLTFTLVRGKKTYSRLSVAVKPGINRQKLKLPKGVKPGTYSLKVSFKPSGQSWAVNGSAKIAFLKAASKKK